MQKKELDVKLKKPVLTRQGAECERCRYHPGPCKRVLTREQMLERWARMQERKKRWAMSGGESKPFVAMSE